MCDVCAGELRCVDPWQPREERRHVGVTAVRDGETRLPLPEGPR